MKKKKSKIDWGAGIRLDVAVIFLFFGMATAGWSSWQGWQGVKKEGLFKAMSEVGKVDDKPAKVEADDSGWLALGIKSSALEEGNGAEVVGKMMKIRPNEPQKDRRVMELAGQVARKKDFSLYPEVIPYPKDLTELSNEKIYSDNLINLKQQVYSTVEDISQREDLPLEGALQNLLVMGRRIRQEDDFNSSAGFLTGVGIEESANQALIDYYHLMGDESKTEAHQRYGEEVKGFGEQISRGVIRWSDIIGEEFNQSTAEAQLEKIEQFGQTSQQVDQLLPLALVYYNFNDTRTSLAQQALVRFQQSPSQFIRDFSTQVLAGDFKNQAQWLFQSWKRKILEIERSS